jgi:hypothetical protein
MFTKIAAAFLAAAFMYLSEAAFARSCVDDILERKTDDGDVLVMSSGAIYKVLPGDESSSMGWAESADVLICETPLTNSQGRRLIFYEIINTEEANERVSAERLR